MANPTKTRTSASKTTKNPTRTTPRARSTKKEAFRLPTNDLVMGRGQVDQRIRRGDVRLMRPVLHPEFRRRLDDTRLQRLIDNPPRLDGTATKHLDGRRTRIVIASVHDAAGATRPGIPVQLRHADRIVDRSVTNREGAVVLLVPEGAHDLEVVVNQGAKEVTRRVEFQGDHAIVDIVASHLEETFETIAHPADPFDRLPADFSPRLCSILPEHLGMRGHQMLQNPMDRNDFRSHRNRLIKRFTVPRVGESIDGEPPKRYLVTVRQDWHFLGYTLGELQQVSSLDPGQIIDETVNQATRTLEKASHNTHDQLRRTLNTVQNTLNRINSVDTLVDVATQAHTQVDVNGYAKATASLETPGLFGGLAAGLFGGSLGGTSAGTEFGTTTTTHTWASALTRTSMDTSLYVNNLMRSAQSQVNQVVRTAVATLRDVRTELTRTVGQVSPLLSRVTNLLRWSVYENYAVCTHVEDVVEVQSVEVADVSEEGVLFPAEDIVEYRRFFEPGMLEPRLRPHFDILERAVARERSADMPVKAVDILIDYTAQIAGAELRCRIGQNEERIRLEPGGHQAALVVDLQQALPPGQLPDLKADLFMDDAASGHLVPDLLKMFGGDLLDKSAVRVTRMRLRYRTGGVQERAPEQDVYLGNQLRTHGGTQHAGHSIDLQVPAPADITQYNPLFVHVNRNRTYYMGLLLQAALRNPSLRDDAWQLAAFDADHPIWRLPILGFEGDRVLVVGNVDPKDEFARRLLNDDGAGALVQVAAPGAYSEALEGLLSLADAEGKIHPNLHPPAVPNLPAVALVDNTGKVVGNGQSTENPLTTP